MPVQFTDHPANWLLQAVVDAVSRISRPKFAKSINLTTAILISMASLCSAQTGSLAVTSATGIPGNSVTVRLTLTSVPGAEPAALQWSLNYPTTSVASFSAAPSAAAIAAGKSLVCSGNQCVLYGLNAQPLPNGDVATFTFQLSANASGSTPLQLSNTLGASVVGDSLSMSATSGSIFAHVTPTGGVSHVAIDGNLTTGIFILNTGSSPAAYSIQFFDDSGNAVTFPFTTGAANLISGKLAAQGSAYYEADAVQPGLISGWGQIVADPGVVIQALFRNHVNGTYYEAAVPSTPGGTEFLVPFDTTTFATTGQPFATGLAIANLNDLDNANVTCTAYDQNGIIIPNAVQIPKLPASGHWSGYQFPQLASQRGTIDCASNSNLAVTVLRFLGFELSSLPVVTNPTGASGSTQTGAIAQVVAGGNLTTGIFVLNTGAASAPYTINFFDDTGKAVSLPFASGSATSVTGTLPAHGSTYYEAANPQIATIPNCCWGQISAGSSVVIQSLFRNAVNGVYYEAAVPSTPGGSKEFLIPFDSTTVAGAGQSLVTGVAIANLDSSAATVTCTAYNPSGVVIPNAVVVPQLPGLGHWAEFNFPLLNGLRGTVDCVSNTNVSATALRFLGSSLSSLPVVTK
jgi:hypothetical protein